MKINEALKIINEEWKDTFKIHGEAVEVFVDPTLKELEKIKGKYDSVRLLANSKTKELIVWEGGWFHEDVINELGLYRYDDFLFAGEAEKRNGKWVYDMGSWDINMLEDEPSRAIDILEKNWSWLTKYPIDFSGFFAKLKDLAKDLKDPMLRY